MQVRLLGPVDVIVNGEPRAVRGLRRQAVLATLALRHGETVSIDHLVDAVWGDAAPSTARNTLQSHVSYLRSVFGDKNVIRAQPPGYLLNAGDGTDALQAERLLLEARLSADPAQGIRLLTVASALWRGPSMAGLTDLPGLDREAGRLGLLRDEVRRALTEARLAAGEHQALVPELEQVAAGRPLDEQVQAQLMLALYRSGRRADALTVYRRLCHVLTEELGVDASQPLRAMEVAILRQDRVLDLPERPTATDPALAPVPVPAQLPPVPAFAGRRAELAGLDAILLRSARSRPGAPANVAIAVLSGTAGVGKTALALHWAHRTSGEFPDGQLFVNLQGFGPAGTALEPADALRGFLEALGVPQARIPADLAARAGLYRSLLTGKHILLVLDNARDAGQVRPLLPGAPWGAAIITSRSQLAGLAATEGASHLTLDLLTPADGRELLVSRLGGNRIAREPAAVTRIIDRCARLPLALTITAARATTARNFSLAAIADELGDASRALDPFHGGDAATDVRSVFSWSYRALSPDAARLFRLLGLHPGPVISVPAAASLGEIETRRARLLLAELSRAHLLAEPAPGLFAFHDLLRAYAAEQAGAADDQPVRDSAVRRLLGHYLATCYRAATLIEPNMDPLEVRAAGAGVVPAELGTAQDALSWFAAERAGVLAAVRLAGDAGLARQAWQLAWCACVFLLRGGLSDDNVIVQEAGLAAARQAGDACGEAHALHGLALGYARSGRFGEAAPLLERALSLYGSTGDQVGQARIHNSLTWIAEHEERLADALVHATRALEIYRAAGHRAGEGMVLNDVGFCHARLGNYRQAREYCERGLAMARQNGERNWEAAALDSLGLVYHGLGDQRRAVGCYEQAADLYRELGDRFNEADTLVSLGDIELRARDAEAARKAWSQAALIFDEIGHPDGDEVRAKLVRAELRPRAEGQTPGAGGQARSDRHGDSGQGIR